MTVVTPLSVAQADRDGACRLGVHGAIWILIGVVFSGPVALILVESTHPRQAVTARGAPTARALLA